MRSLLGPTTAADDDTPARSHRGHERQCDYAPAQDGVHPPIVDPTALGDAGDNRDEEKMTGSIVCCIEGSANSPWTAITAQDGSREEAVESLLDQVLEAARAR